MFDSAPKAFFHVLSHSRVLKKLASRVGLRTPTSFARRFVAGETVEEAVAAARVLEARGLTETFDHLGEAVASLTGAAVATRDYMNVVTALMDAGVARNISIKLTQMGLDVDRATAVDNIRTILERTEPAGFFVRIDMENSPYTDVTLDIFDTLWQQGYRQVGIVLQAALRRSERDLQRLNALGARIRLVKGAYKEPHHAAYRKKADVDEAYERMMKTLLTDGTYPAIATHDPAMIDTARRWATEHGVAADRFEFQMLYGVRRDLQNALVQAGYRVRIYVPFGRDWFPYFMRRLGERPANVGFVLRSVVGESAASGPRG